VQEESVAFNKEQFRELIEEVLREADLYSASAVELLMLTCATESNFGTYIKQVRGPALGVFQMEPNTEKDIWKHYLEYRDATEATVKRYDTVAEDDLAWNLGYMIIMARVHYLRVKEPLPPADDLNALAYYWKKYYNTFRGKGTVKKAVNKYKEFCV
jgi:hypothetical protein